MWTVHVYPSAWRLSCYDNDLQLMADLQRCRLSGLACPESVATSPCIDSCQDPHYCRQNKGTSTIIVSCHSREVPIKWRPVLKSLRHYMRAQSQRHRTTDRLEERCWRGSARRSSLEGRQRDIVSQTNTGTVSKATLGKLLRDGVERI